MTTALETTSDIELKLVRILRQRSIEAIERMGEEEAARQLRLSEFGVEALRSRSGWTLEEAVRVSVALGLLDDSVTRTVSQGLR